MDFWKQSINYLKNVGPIRAELLIAEAGIQTFEDLLHYFPRKYLDRTQVSHINQLNPNENEYVSLVGKLGKFDAVQNFNQKRLSTTLRDRTGWIQLIWFQGVNYIHKQYKEDDEVVLFGKIIPYKKTFSIAHPEMELLNDEAHPIHHLKIIPFYPSSDKLSRGGLDSKGFRKLTNVLLNNNKNPILETLSPSIIKQYKLISRQEALYQIHFPTSPQSLSQARFRLKFEELFYFELTLAQRKNVRQLHNQSNPFSVIGEHFNTFYHSHLPFQLTNAQKRVIKEIRADVAKPLQMNRLLQGDVGSGKTIVALMTALMAIDNGFQTAILAPTEILAEQHFQTIRNLLDKMPLNIDLMIGGQKKSTRQRVLYDLLGGTTNIVIGTHALLEDSVKFANLGLTIIDEQHKFGVIQRSKLWQKRFHIDKKYPHNLAMTATPIPRTLAMTVYGDVEISIIDELPAGRQPISTILRNESHRLEAFGFMKKQIEQGRQIYIVYPLVEESIKLDLLAVKEGFDSIQRSFQQYRVAMVHGKMESEAKDFEMQRFKRGEVHILVATTVIEVGVDIPNATVIMIENAERFGLSQLHQLRGRVGRGAEKSYCILLTSKRVTPEAKKRLQAMVDTTDGFKIAQIDLEIRGPGDFLGIRQSGLPEFKMANILTDNDILLKAREAAFEIIRQDATLELPENEVVRRELGLFLIKHNLMDLNA